MSRTYQKEIMQYNYIELQRMLALATAIAHYLLMDSSFKQLRYIYA